MWPNTPTPNIGTEQIDRIVSSMIALRTFLLLPRSSTTYRKGVKGESSKAEDQPDCADKPGRPVDFVYGRFGFLTDYSE